jgi:hypothetical protein
MYSRIKKIGPLKIRFFYQNEHIKKPISLHHLLQIWPEFGPLGNPTTHVITLRSIMILFAFFRLLLLSVYSKYSLRYLLSAFCRLMLVFCCHVFFSFLLYAPSIAVCCLLSAFSFVQRVLFYPNFYTP